MANPTIAALRAASASAPVGPSGPQALNYSWMNTPGQPLVIPVRPPAPPRSPKARRPPDPGLPPPPGSPFIQPQLPGGDGGGYSFVGDWGNDAPEFLVVGPEEPPPRDRPPVRRDRDMGEPGSRYMPESVPSAGMDYGLMEFIQPVPQAEAPVAAPAPAVELAPEPVPYMPQIVEPEAPTPAPVRQPKVPQPLEQPEFDQEFLQYLMMSEFGGPGLR